jgi:hypothetical protein
MHLRIDKIPASLYSPERAAKLVEELQAGGEDARIVDVGNDKDLVRIDLYDDGEFVMSWRDR